MKFINLHIRNVLFFVPIRFLIFEKAKMFKIIHRPVFSALKSTVVQYTLLIEKIITLKNARAWVSIVFT